MFKYTYGKKLETEQLECCKKRLISKFAHEYDIGSNRLWNCLKQKPTCMEFEEAKKIDIPDSVFFYLERQDEVYHTTYMNICKYIDNLEPWEYIDAYIFDDNMQWLLAITHEELRCLVIGLERELRG